MLCKSATQLVHATLKNSVRKCSGGRDPVTSSAYAIHPTNWLRDQEDDDTVQLASQFARKEMAPFMSQWDKQGELPLDCLRKAGEAGFGGIYTTTDFGGSGMSRLQSSLIFEQLSQGCVSTAAYMSIHNMVCWMLDTYASEQLRAAHLPDLTAFQKLASYCLTEPNSGSDAASIRTTAKQVGDYYVVNGSKAFISGAGTSEVYAVMMRKEGGPPGAKGIFCLLLEKGMEGFTFGKKEEKMGWNSQPTRIITFEDVKVPISNQIGADGHGFNIAMAGLNGGRVNIASCSLGAAQRSLDLAIEHAKTRKQFGKSLDQFQHTQFKLAELATKLYASRMLVRRAAEALDRNTTDKVALCAMAKQFATDNCYEVVHGAMQVLGGYGFLKDYPLEQFLRDIRVHQILEGTNEVMKMIVSRDLLTKDVFWK